MTDSDQGSRSEVSARSGLPPLGKPAERALGQAGYTRLVQLADVRESDLAGLHGVGPSAMGRLRQALADAGLSFRGE